MTHFDPQKHHRRSMRLKHYDYSQSGAYFITLVTNQRDELFGEIFNGEMQLSALGKIVHEEWMRSIQIRKEIRLNEDEFIVMPNHVHGIVWIVDVGADCVRPCNHPDSEEGARRAPLPSRVPRSVSSFVAGFKAVVTSRAGKELNMSAIWQRNFYDHIIRDEKDFMNIWQYIDNNTRRWKDDQLYTSAAPNRFNQG